jgi:hypothetical protein
MGDPNNNRGSSWQYALLAIPAIAAAVGVQYLVRNHSATSTHVDIATALKPSFYKMDDKTQKQTGQYKDIMKSEGRVPASNKSQGGTKTAQNDTIDEDQDLSDDPGASHQSGKGNWVKPILDQASQDTELDDAIGTNRHEKPITGENVASGTFGALGGNTCQPIEYKGDGPFNTKVTKEEWNQVMNQFHDVKDKLASWLEHHKKEFMDKTVAAMEQQVRRVEIERPPTSEEPDLNWRGVAVFTYDMANKPIIRVGGGFVKLATKEPQRARFELARLVAQSIAPCELQKIGADAAWEPLLKCMDVKEDNACGANTFSDAGWAVSSTLATLVAAPGCTLPAFATPEYGKCLKKPPLPLSTAMIEDSTPVATTVATAPIQGMEDK